jgi:spore photoproduct lyase family protein
VSTIYYEPAAVETERGREVLARFPEAERVEVSSHQNIPGLFGNEGAVKDWLRIKRTVLVLGIRKTFTVRPNGRSADFIAPGLANGCAMACVYCYVPRHKGYANPVSVFVNFGDFERTLRRHAAKQGTKTEPNQTDPEYWTYDIGENSDVSADALLSGNVRDTVALFRDLPNAKATFATKFVNREMLDYDPQRKTRLRFSLMPQSVSKTVDIRTSPIAERIAAINDFVDAGYEVHLNFSPVIVTEGWLESYRELFEQVYDALSPAARAQVAAEVIFLTHNEDMHGINTVWHPKGEALLWQPELQESKTSQYGGKNLRYRSGTKGKMVRDLLALLSNQMPYCPVRYAF